MLTSTTFVATGTAGDDNGVGALSYWFRDANNQYLQEDGSVASSFNTFRGLPDVVGATSATWQYEVTLPHEGEWRMSATAIDDAGQSDLRSATRDWLITSTGVAPTVAINTPAPMTPPTAAPAYTVAPGGQLTFGGPANDEDDLATSRSPCATTPPGSSWPPTAPGAPTRSRVVPRLPAERQWAELRLELHDAVQPHARGSTPSACGPPTTSG